MAKARPVRDTGRMFDREDESPERRTMGALAGLSIGSESVERYGPDPAQFIEWYGPDDGDTIVFIHGAGFLSDMDVAYARPAALELGTQGFHVALVGLRKERGNPNITLADLHTIAERPDFADAIWLGHSLGGSLAMSVVLSPDVAPTRAVTLAPYASLKREVSEYGDPSGIARWIGSFPDEAPEVYDRLDPVRHFERIGAEGYASRKLSVKILHGEADTILPASSLRPLANTPFEIAVIPGANHMDLIRPGHDAWLLLLGALSKN